MIPISSISPTSRLSWLVGHAVRGSPLHCSLTRSSLPFRALLSTTPPPPSSSKEVAQPSLSRGRPRISPSRHVNVLDTLVPRSMTLEDRRARHLWVYPLSSKWSADENARLAVAVSGGGVGGVPETKSRGPSGGSDPDWGAVASLVSTRDAQQCKRRWQLVDPRSVKGRFTASESGAIRRGIRKYGTSWALIAQDCPGRKPESIRRHWERQLRPGLVRGPYSVREETLLVAGVVKYAFRWSLIQERFLPARYGVSIHMRFDNMLRGRIHGKETGFKIPLRTEFRRQLQSIEELGPSYPHFRELPLNDAILSAYKSFLGRRQSSLWSASEDTTISNAIETYTEDSPALFTHLEAIFKDKRPFSHLHNRVQQIKDGLITIKPWTSTEIASLVEMYHTQKLDWNHIAETLGRTTHDVIYTYKDWLIENLEFTDEYLDSLP